MKTMLQISPHSKINYAVTYAQTRTMSKRGGGKIQDSIQKMAFEMPTKGHRLSANLRKAGKTRYQSY